MIQTSVFSIDCSSQKEFEIFPFYFNGKVQTDFPVKWGLTYKNAGTMRFRWNEKSENREKIFNKFLNEYKIPEKRFVPIELIHSKDVIKVLNKNDSKNLLKDGIITENKNLIPTVTVADCVPIYFCDFKQKILGVVHSGWKGTGIIENAINILKSDFKSKSENICVTIGPHIQNCCYIVDEERANYFTKNFGPDCVLPFKNGEKLKNKNIELWKNSSSSLFRLSLLEANLFLLGKNNIPRENILFCKNCTCCEEIFGSNRRETSLAQKNGEPFDKAKCFTVQAAFTVNLS